MKWKKKARVGIPNGAANKEKNNPESVNKRKKGSLIEGKGECTKEN